MSAARYRRNPACVWRATGSFLVAAVPPQPPTRIVGSAGLVWGLLHQARTVDELVAEVVIATGAPSAVVRDDIESMLRDLVPTTIVEESPSCTP